MNDKRLNPPIASKQPHELVTHADVRIDDYFWLREKESPDVRHYLKEENAYTAEMMAHTTALQGRLYDEMVGRIQETDETVPVRRGDYFYYSRTEEGKQYSIYCRRKGSMASAEQVILDVNAYGADHDYVSLGIFELSPDGSKLAFGLDLTGAETYTISIKSLQTGALLSDALEQVAGSAEWGSETILYYNTEDAAKRSDKLWRHELGRDQSTDTLILHEPDALFGVYPYKTLDNRFLMVMLGAIEQTETHFIDLQADAAGALQIIEPRQSGVRYSVYHRGGQFYILTNANGAVNQQVMVTAVEKPARKNWRVFIPVRDDVTIQGITVFADYLALIVRADALRQLAIYTFATSEMAKISFEEAVYAVNFGNNVNFESSVLRFTYTSPTTPSTTFDYDMGTRERTLLKQQPVLGGYDSAEYETERIWVQAKDGEQIPVSMVYRKGSRDKGPAPLHLYGYGSYGHTIEPGFSSNRLCMLDRGVIFAIAHVRGSQMMGRRWYDDGKFLNKRNTFTDFMAVAEKLIDLGYTSPQKMSMEGRSAGGLLMGAVLNLAPQLFNAAIAGVPFVDVVTTMLDTSIPLTVGEFEEWGNPQDKAYYDYMLSYSPYDNVTAQAYPHILVTAGLNDPRVQYFEPAKWVAKLRAMKTDDNRLLMRMHMGAGHFSSSGRYDYLKDIAFDYAFLLDRFGLGES